MQAQGSLENLNESEVFDKKLQVNYSKHDHIAPGRAPEKLPDGSEAPKDYEDFSTSSLNRFKKPEHFKRKCVCECCGWECPSLLCVTPLIPPTLWLVGADIYKPSAVVHFANGPPSLTEEVRYCCCCSRSRCCHPQPQSSLIKPCHLPVTEGVVQVEGCL